MRRLLTDLADYFTAALLRALIWCLHLIPYERRIPLIGRMTAGWLGRVSGYRRRALRNLALIYPDMAAPARERLATASLDNLGRALFELFDPKGFARHLAQSSLGGPGLGSVMQARAEGRAVMFVTGHFGSQDAARRKLAKEIKDIHAIYRPMANRYFNRRYVRMFEDLHGKPFAQGRDGTRGFLSALKAGDWGTLMLDVWHKGGVMIDFLGQPAPTSTASADFARHTDALYVPYFARRRADGLTFDIIVEEPIPHGDPVDMLRAATRKLEAQIAEAPEQWYWVHRRWKPANGV